MGGATPNAEVLSIGGVTTKTRWLLVTASTSAGSGSLRVLVWRRLRGMGALYLQQSVCLLPDRRAVKADLEALTGRVEREGGSMRVLCITVSDPGQNAALIEDLNAARDEEYGEVLERLPSFFAEIAHETARDNATFEEVEESEADLNRFRDWLAKIEARDYFGAPLAAQVAQQMSAAQAALDEFEAAALRADEAAAPSRQARRGLDVVDGST